MNRWLGLGARLREFTVIQITMQERLVLVEWPRQEHVGTGHTTATMGSQQKQFGIE